LTRTAFIVALCALTACEAPLNMDNVERSRADPIHRTDRYQAIARNDSTIVVVGNQGVILRSADEGASWQRVELPEWPALIDITACPNGDFIALAFAPLVFVSSDAGASWTPRPLPTTESPQALTCAPDNRIWVVGAFTNRWSSADAGLSWEEATNDEDALLTTVQFFNAEQGVITGEFGTVLTTSDGGETWDSMTPLEDEFYPQAAYFKDPHTGWIVGLGGVILHTIDGGESWTHEATDTEVPLYGSAAVGDTLFVVGGEGTLLRYDGGAWHSVAHGKPIRLYIRAIQAVDDTRAIIAGVGGTLHIIDVGGA
jgi:photosystem II stability/assembly factor-like uncharacterized protein